MTHNNCRCIVVENSYQERVRLQHLAWVEGRSYHNRVDNECCPDFSCCQASLFEKDREKRQLSYNKRYGMN